MGQRGQTEAVHGVAKALIDHEERAKLWINCVQNYR